MSRAHCLLLESIHATAHEAFVEHGVAVDAIKRGLSEDELIGQLRSLPRDAPVVVGIRSKTHITSKVLESVPNLTAIGAFCIGTDQIDLAAARRHGVAVFNAPFSSTRSVAELILGLVIMLSRQVFVRSSAAHQGRWAKSADGAREVRGKTLGIIGYGHIGSQLSILAEALGMRVLFHDIVNKLPLGNAQSAGSLTELLAKSDFVSLHVPDTELTRSMIGEAELRTMKHGAYLLNASRGQVVDIDALRSALLENRLAGAAIDVFPQEPPSKEEPFSSPLQGLDNVILTPHIGGSTQEAQANIGLEVAEGVIEFLSSGKTFSCVSLPPLDAPLKPDIARIINVHQNTPGVLSAINRVVAESDINIVGQYLSTLEDVGLLFVDMAREPSKADELCRRISALEPSVRTRLVSG